MLAYSAGARYANRRMIHLTPRGQTVLGPRVLLVLAANVSLAFVIRAGWLKGGHDLARA